MTVVSSIRSAQTKIWLMMVLHGKSNHIEWFIDRIVSCHRQTFLAQVCCPKTSKLFTLKSARGSGVTYWFEVLFSCFALFTRPSKFQVNSASSAAKLNSALQNSAEGDGLASNSSRAEKANAIPILIPSGRVSPSQLGSVESVDRIGGVSRSSRVGRIGLPDELVGSVA